MNLKSKLLIGSWYAIGITTFLEFVDRDGFILQRWIFVSMIFTVFFVIMFYFGCLFLVPKRNMDPKKTSR